MQDIRLLQKLRESAASPAGDAVPVALRWPGAPPALPRPLRYGAALAMAVLAVAVTASASEVLDSTMFLVPLAAVALSGWLGGLGPALTATAASALLTAVFILGAASPLDLLNAGDAIPLGVFLGVGLLIGGLTEPLRAAAGAAAVATSRARSSVAEARAQRLRTELVLKSVSDGITVQSPDGRLIYANDAAARLIGFPTADDLLRAQGGDLAGRLEILDEDGSPVPPESLPGRVAVRDGVQSERLLRYRREGGAPDRWSLVRATPALDEAGEVLFAVNVFHDLTERIRYERELESSARELRTLTAELESTVGELRRKREEADAARADAESASRTKSRFMAVMSHELRTPLNAIMGYQELLEHGVVGPVTERQREQLGRIGQSAHHLLQLIEQVLALSRIEGGVEEVASETVLLPDLVRHVVELVQPLADRKGLDLAVHAEAAHVVRTDPVRLRQVLLNLLSNAVKFTERGGVRVELETGESWVAITVRDTGPGIPAEERERIFEPFVQGAGDGVGRAPGTGLGLTVARQLAELLGGSLSLESQPGVGSAFTVRLPR